MFRRHYWLVIDEISKKQQPDIYQGFLESNLDKAIVKLTEERNSIDVTAISVRKLTLLISPEQFDLELPIKITINGHQVFNQIVAPSVDTLLKWASVDLDSNRLYAKELTFQLEN